MRRLFIVLSVCLCFLFCGCEFFKNDPDPSDSYVTVDYSKYVKENCYEFPPETDAVTFYNCFINEFGLGEKNITGVYSHTEAATLNGHYYSDTITKNIIKINVYNYKKTDPTTSCFCVDFTTDNGEVMRFLYEWQFHINNYWSNTLSNGTITINKN